MKKKKYSQFVR